jgi:predicted DNA-binding transcriptional regulator AlpA
LFGAFTVNQYNHSGFLRIKGVQAKIPVSRATWYAGIKAGKYPKPIRLSEGVSVWRVSDIDALCHQIEQQAAEVSK